VVRLRKKERKKKKEKKKKKERKELSKIQQAIFENVGNK
jgi:hypothetical protein